MKNTDYLDNNYYTYTINNDNINDNSIIINDNDNYNDNDNDNDNLTDLQKDNMKKNIMNILFLGSSLIIFILLVYVIYCILSNNQKKTIITDTYITDTHFDSDPDPFLNSCNNNNKLKNRLNAISSILSSCNNNNTDTNSLKFNITPIT